MKASGHPKYYLDAKATCACGNTFETGSTKTELTVDICSACHPFYTGEMRFVDTMGRVERFQQTQNKTAGQVYVSKKQKKVMKKRQEDAEEAARPKSLKEMLDRVKAVA